MLEMLSTGSTSLFFILIIPGFVSQKVWSLIHPTKKYRAQEIIYEILCYSFINFALLFIVVDQLLKGDLSQLTWYIYWFILLFLGPVLWPILYTGILNIKFIKERTINKDACSWDHFFKNREVSFILVHLNSGKLIGGLFGKGSYASAYPEEKDLYLSQTWKVDRNGKFLNKITNSKGMYITYSEISYLEFFQAIPKAGGSNGKES